MQATIQVVLVFGVIHREFKNLNRYPIIRSVFIICHRRLHKINSRRWLNYTNNNLIVAPAALSNACQSSFLNKAYDQPSDPSQERNFR